ncbi:PAS and ANTAR domain-containing protein [Cellulosimicrobium marinum]|uniref:PAS and ANTAR domain-containing protein n=1 Tax=Cellulosimicrobium marinum TaxID=1638992 RepID=UPI001E649409|nr:PAS and ANTAR domain-containing protein [Cellulosimicrobium marinum]MCB7135838.1 PAS and ANTAR domain-containing protein [Cellulosimicrobium marinum]
MPAVDHTAVERALALGTHQLTGQYRVDLRTGAWWWSDEAYLIHGFAPGEVVPTTELVLAHKHPDDRERVRRILDSGLRTGAPFTSVHRITDARGRERTLTIIGQGVPDEATGELAAVEGYFVDITAAVVERSDERASEQIAAAAASRGVIEQAKGVLAAVYGMSTDDAFRLLRAVSNNRNLRLRDLADRVVEAAGSGGPRARAALDPLLGARRR